jgi:hypothetical protein
VVRGGYERQFGGFIGRVRTGVRTLPEIGTGLLVKAASDDRPIAVDLAAPAVVLHTKMSALGEPTQGLLQAARRCIDATGELCLRYLGAPGVAVRVLGNGVRNAEIETCEAVVGADLCSPFEHAPGVLVGHSKSLSSHHWAPAA